MGRGCRTGGMGMIKRLGDEDRARWIACKWVGSGDDLRERRRVRQRPIRSFRRGGTTGDRFTSS